MNKLFIEIYNESIRAHIVNTDNYSVLLSKEYKNSMDWATQIYQDVQDVDESIDNYSILFNQGTTKIYTKEESHRAMELDQKGLKVIKKKIVESLFLKYPDYRTTYLKVYPRPSSPGKYELRYIYELVNQDQLKAISFALADAGFKTEGNIVLSSLNNVTRALKQYDDKTIVNIHVEDEFMRLVVMTDKKPVYVSKTPYGLDRTVEEISKKMNISTAKAKELFKNFGNIPPEAVVDNKVIHSYKDKQGNLHVFTKKDLSGYVTNYVDKLINSLKPAIEGYLGIETKVIFSGDVVTLRGFEDYLRKTLNLYKTEVYESKTFGFVSVNTISMDGVIDKCKEEKQHQIQEQTKERHLSRFIKDILGKREV